MHTPRVRSLLAHRGQFSSRGRATPCHATGGSEKGSVCWESRLLERNKHVHARLNGFQSFPVSFEYFIFLPVGTTSCRYQVASCKRCTSPHIFASVRSRISNHCSNFGSPHNQLQREGSEWSLPLEKKRGCRQDLVLIISCTEEWLMCVLSCSYPSSIPVHA